MANVTGKNWVIPARANGSVYMEDFIPVLSAISVPSSGIGTTSATVYVTTSLAKGTLYLVVTNSATVPAVSQIKAGTDHNGLTPLFSTTAIIVMAGINNVPLIGLSGTATKFVYIVHAANGYDSSIVFTSFVLSTASTFPSYNAAISVSPAPTGWFNIRDVNQAVLTAIPVLEPGSTLKQASALVPSDVGTAQLADGWNVRADFIEFGSLTPVQPTKISTANYTLNSSAALSIPVGQLGGIAANQWLTMIISTASDLTPATITTLQAGGWTVHGSGTPVLAGTPILYICGKHSVTNEIAVSLVHASGKMDVELTNWNNCNAGTVFDAAPIFSANVQNGVPAFSSPAGTPTVANCMAISVVSIGGTVTFTSQPASWALLQQGHVSTVYWTGVAFKKQLTAALVAQQTWNITGTVSNSNSATFFLRAAATGITKLPFVLSLFYNSATKTNYPINLTIDPY